MNYIDTRTIYKLVYLINSKLIEIILDSLDALLITNINARK